MISSIVFSFIFSDFLFNQINKSIQSTIIPSLFSIFYFLSTNQQQQINKFVTYSNSFITNLYKTLTNLNSCYLIYITPNNNPCPVQAMATLLFNNFHLKPQPLTQITNMIINHPLFEDKVIEFRQLFPSLDLKPQHLIHLGTLSYAFMLPQFPTVQHKRLATQLYESLQLQHDISAQKNTLTYMHLAEYLGKICLASLENIDIRNCLGFLTMLIDRITDRFIVDVRTNQKKPLHYHFKLQLMDAQTIIHDTSMPEQFHRLMSKDVYYEEKVYYDEEQIKDKQNVVIVRELKSSLNTVVPLGYVCEDFLSQLINNEFETKNSYRLKPSRRVNIDKLEYWISPNQTVNNYIRDEVVNQQIFYTTCVLSASHLPQNPTQSSKVSYTVARINHTFSRQAYYQKLKDIKEDKVKYFNILSEFFDRDEFNIDEITLTREKLIARRKQHLLGIQPKQSVNKDIEKDFEDEARMLPQKIYQQMMLFWDQKRMELNIKQLTQTLKSKLQQGKNINTLIESNLSQHSSLPFDNPNPFTQDIITYAQKQPLQLLIIGRPKSGKSTMAKAIAKKYSLVYISVQSVINKVFERIKFFEQNPPQADEDGNVIGGLTAIEKCIVQDLNAGKPVQEQDILDLINNQLQKDFTQSRGFILDLPFEYKKYWIDAVISNKILLPKINCRFFTHIVQVQQTDQQWKHFSQQIMQKPQDLTVTSALDRYLLTKPKPAPVQGQEQQPAADDEQKPQPLKQQNLLYIKWKQGLFSLIQHLTQHIHPRRYLKIQNSYQSVDECLQLLENKLYIIPLPRKIQGNEKQLLTVGHDQTKLVRKWSPWGIVDPVQLKSEKLINGKFQFAAEYAGRVFVFDNQNNLNTFLNSPRRFLDKLPQLPKKTNICITGPRKSGKKTLAKKLSEIYNLQIINFEEILQRVILKQKSLQAHVPSNPEKRSKNVHLSEGQFKDFSKGTLLNAKDILPIVLYQLGIALQKKPVGWGVQKQQGTQAQQQQEKKTAPAKKKKKDKGQQDERPKTPPIQDLSLKQIIPQINHFGKLNQIRGYIMINFPNNQEQLNSLKQFNIPIDKLIILNDKSQQNPNKILGQRLNDAELEQIELFYNAINPVKQALGEQVCTEISINRTPEQILNAVRQLIDPFYLKTDDDTINRVLADKQQDNDPIPYGFSGEYCPVALKEKWLIKGKQQLEAGVQGKRFRFCGQKQLGQFKQNPQLYLNKQNTLIPPRVLFMGLRGVGLTTQLLKLTQKYKIPILNLKETLLQHLQGQKNKRKTERYYKRGFKKPQFDEQGKQLEDEQLNAESPEFEKRVNEIQVTRKIFEGIDQILINGNFFDVDEQKISTNIVQLLTEARRLPEVVYVLKAQQNKWLARNLDTKQIQRELQAQIQKIRAQKQQEIQRQRKAALQAGQEFTPPAQEEQNFPKLQERLAQKAQSLKARRQADAGALDGFIQAFRALNIEVIQISCQRQVKHVTDKINYSLKNYIQDRIQRWEKYNMLPIQRHRVPDFLNNFIAKQSRFGKLNPISLIKDLRPCPLIYNDRVYYLKDQEERQTVVKNPSLLSVNRPIPQDVNTVVGVFVIGKAKTGKTTLSRTLAEKLGLVYLSFTEIISAFVQEHKDIEIIHILNDLKQGKTLSDQQVVSLSIKRTKHHDCQKHGWVLDGLPQNKNQAQLLNRRGIIPTQVFSLNLTDIEVKKRVFKTKSSEYEFDIEVVHQRLQKNKKSLAEVELYYESKYNNLKILDASLSKWGIFQTARKIIQKRAKSQREFIRALALFEAAQVSQIGINFNCVLNNMSEYQNYCPISYKLKRQYIRKCLHSHQNLALYNKKLYIFNTQKELHDFLQNPETFIVRGPSFQPPTQVQNEDFKNLAEKSENRGYCMVELLRKKLVRGNFSYGLIYKNKFFLTSSPKNMKLFIRNPALYEMVKLPDKLPVEFEKKNELKKIAKRNDCTAFLQHHLSNIMMRSLAQLGYRRPKYPTLSSKQSALKFLSISLKSTNPNKDDEYRQKYTQQLQKFIKQCSLSEQIRSQVGRKNKLGQLWQQADEENLIKLCEEYSEFMKSLQQADKLKYFSKFIR